MPRTPEQNRLYMAEYRKRQRREVIMNTTMPAQAVRELVDAKGRIRELEEEVRHLKAELAKRARDDEGFAAAVAEKVALRDPGFNSHPFTPVPKRAGR